MFSPALEELSVLLRELSLFLLAFDNWQFPAEKAKRKCNFLLHHSQGREALTSHISQMRRLRGDELHAKVKQLLRGGAIIANQVA